jgi:hypothetical protein
LAGNTNLDYRAEQERLSIASSSRAEQLHLFWDDSLRGDFVELAQGAAG